MRIGPKKGKGRNGIFGVLIPDVFIRLGLGERKRRRNLNQNQQTPPGRQGKFPTQIARIAKLNC
jgi:hypothetical protein